MDRFLSRFAAAFAGPNARHTPLRWARSTQPTNLRGGGGGGGGWSLPPTYFLLHPFQLLEGWVDLAHQKRGVPGHLPANAAAKTGQPIHQLGTLNLMPFHSAILSNSIKSTRGARSSRHHPSTDCPIDVQFTVHY